MALAKKHELAEALAPDGAHEALGVGIEVGTARRQADRGDPVLSGNSIEENL
jgi:threonine dehydrogenase-like Zn-dependent dehydrogenase